MYKIIALSIVAVLFSSGLYASSNQHTPMSTKTIKKMDRKYNKHKAMKRDFKSKKEFKQKSKRDHRARQDHKSNSHSRNAYNNGQNYQSDDYYNDYERPRQHRQRGYRYSKRGWELAYRYDRADFYDNQGYYYGYFNRYGYYFEEVFYAYDRYYGYRDRAKGRGLFDHRYYRPASAQYYGFSR